MITDFHHHVCKNLKAKFETDIHAIEMNSDMPVLTISIDGILPILTFLYQNPDCQFQFLTTLCGVHYPDNTGAELGVVYHLHSLRHQARLRLKAFAPISSPRFPSVTALFATANWMEREAYDFFGILFDGHPDLRRILNMDDLGYFPMRKEYPMEDTTRDDKNDAMFGR